MSYTTNLTSASHYPNEPGWRRNTETSKTVAIAIAPHVKGLEARVLAFLQEKKPGAYSSEEIGTAFGLEPHIIYPRISTLVAQKKVTDSKLRTKNRAGHNVAMWVAV